MKINLTKEECQNTKVAILALAKATNTSEAEMALLLNLAQKFNFVEPKVEEKKEEKNESK